VQETRFTSTSEDRGAEGGRWPDLNQVMGPSVATIRLIIEAMSPLCLGGLLHEVEDTKSELSTVLTGQRQGVHTSSWLMIRLHGSFSLVSH